MNPNKSNIQTLILAIEYYQIQSSPKLSDAQLDHLETILTISESNTYLNDLITNIDIDLAENASSKQEVEEYCNRMREYIKKDSRINIYSLIHHEINLQVYT